MTYRSTDEPNERDGVIAPGSVSPSIPFDKQDELLGVPVGTAREKIRTLSDAERACFVHVLNGVSFAEAARRTGVHVSAAYRLKNRIPDLMERRGLTDEILCAKLEQLLDAKETKFFSAKNDIVEIVDGVDDEGEPTQTRTERVEILVESREVEALDIQLRAFDLATKFKGWTRTVEPEEARDSHDINVNIINVGGGA